MATIDWPTDRAFMPADFSVGADVPLAQWRAPNTGTREVYSRAADRMTCQLSLPPCKRDDAARIESFLAGLLSTGDNVRFPMFHRREPRGAFFGAPTVDGAVAAGVRALPVTGARARPNLLTGASFDLDTNADGRANGWNSYSAGSPGSVSYALSGGTLGTTHTHGTYAQRVNASALAAGGANRAGLMQSATFAAGAFSRFSAAVDVRATAGVTVVLEIDFFDGTPTLLSAPNTSAVPGTTYSRLKLENIAVPAAAVRADFYVWMQSGTGAAAFMDADAAQLEAAVAATAFAGFPTLLGGDFLGAGGNLFQAAYAGVVLSDIGAGSVPLALPVQKAIASGATVEHIAPTGVWQLDAAGITFDYSAGVIMNGLVLPFRQVVA